MQRRDFSKVAAAAATLAGYGMAAAQSSCPQVSAPVTPIPPLPVPVPGPAPVYPTSPASRLAVGTNLSGMEWAKPGLRYGTSSLPNLHFTVPRAADITYLAASGYSKNRLPIQWELLQPMLHDTVANAATKAAIGNPGAFHAGYEAYITGVLDAHAAAGIKCIIDNHNYCRYQDFKFQPDGSVIGLTVPANPLLRPFTTDNTQVSTRIFALGVGVTLKQSNFVDFWKRVALKWGNHPGFGGYGLMNEPHDMPKAGGIIAWNEEAVPTNEDLTVWPTYAQAAITAIRTIDAKGQIYVSGNEWDSAMFISKNPNFPLPGTLAGSNVVYEVHMYLDAASNGFAFDYDTEVAKNFSAGGFGAIHAWTGYDRIRMAIDWAKAKGVKLALTEVGMPIDDPRWQTMFEKAVNYAVEQGCEIYSWMGGNHWPIHNYAINHVPGWHQNKTLEPLVSGVLKAGIGAVKASLFDDGPSYALVGKSVTITVYARGNLARPVTLGVSSNNGGTLSTAKLVIPAGANGQVTFTFAPLFNRVATLTYTSDGQLSGQVPPPRKIFSLHNPVAHADVNLQDGALAIMAKYSVSKWDMSDGHTDYMQGAPAVAGQAVRAIADSGYGSSAGNAMEMINWVNKANDAMGGMSLPVMRVTNGKKNSDHTVYDTWGFWCKKSIKVAGVQPNPKNKVLFNIEEPHFVLAALSIPGQYNTGVVFQASQAEQLYTSELNFTNSCPGATWVDANGQTVRLVSPNKIPVNKPAVMAFTSAPGTQQLRVNAAVVASANATFAPSVFNQMLIGWGFLSYYPRDGFMGNIYAVLSGKGAPTTAEIKVLEKYLGAIAGITL